MTEYFIGLMSGTSLDGVDAVIVEFEQNKLQLVASYYAPFSDTLHSTLLALQTPGDNELHHAALAGNSLSRCYADAITQLLNASGIERSAIRAIGCHGQTVRHRPALGYTLQLANPALLAELSEIAVVADFRSRDIAAGGQGAPLVPAFHDALFRHPEKHRAIVNLGGMANITDLAPGQATRGFDCGPGNVLLDGWIQRYRQQSFDRDGEWAASGQSIPALLAQLLNHPFFALPPPKSCGREQFDLRWLDSLVSSNAKPADVQATLLALTTSSIADALKRFCAGATEIYLCGGGAHNAALRASLMDKLPSGSTLSTCDTLGLNVDWVEAAAFAWLAREHLAERPGNLPAVTGARATRVLGALYPAH